MVLRLWQEWQRLCRFSRSVNTAQSPLCGMMWSTSVALVRRRGSPGGYRTAHSRQNGSRRSCPGRSSSVHSGVEYIQRQDRDASLRRAASLGLCAAQYPPDTRAQHPGCLHGLKGFCAIGLSPPGKTKEPECLDFKGFQAPKEQGMRESNSHQRFWRPLSYHLTNPLCFVSVAIIHTKGTVVKAKLIKFARKQL